MRSLKLLNVLLFSLFSHLLCASSTFSDTNTRKRKQQLTCSVPQWWSSVSVGQSVHSPVFCSLSVPCGQQTFLFLPPLRQQQDVPRLSRGLEGPLKGTLHPFMANANSLRHGDTSSSNNREMILTTKPPPTSTADGYTGAARSSHFSQSAKQTVLNGV